VDVRTHPLPTANDLEDGMFLLKKLPDGSNQFRPQPFVQDSRENLEKLCKKMIKHYGKKFPYVENEWRDWVDNIAPKSDDALEYVISNPLHIPFLNSLFSKSTVDTEFYVSPKVVEKQKVPGYETTNSVVGSNRGKSSKYTTLNERLCIHNVCFVLLQRKM
jgi:hypothetical protein